MYHRTQCLKSCRGQCCMVVIQKLVSGWVVCRGVCLCFSLVRLVKCLGSLWYTGFIQQKQVQCTGHRNKLQMNECKCTTGIYLRIYGRYRYFKRTCYTLYCNTMWTSCTYVYTGNKFFTNYDRYMYMYVCMWYLCYVCVTYMYVHR